MRNYRECVDSLEFSRTLNDFLRFTSENNQNVAGQFGFVLVLSVD
jgi:hypothetical protein